MDLSGIFLLNHETSASLCMMLGWMFGNLFLHFLRDVCHVVIGVIFFVRILCEVCGVPSLAFLWWSVVGEKRAVSLHLGNTMLPRLAIETQYPKMPLPEGDISAALPIASMYGVFTYEYIRSLDETWPHSRGNVGKYSLHGSYGIYSNSIIFPATVTVCSSWSTI